MFFDNNNKNEMDTLAKSSRPSSSSFNNYCIGEDGGGGHHHHHLPLCISECNSKRRSKERQRRQQQQQQPHQQWQRQSTFSQNIELFPPHQHSKFATETTTSSKTAATHFLSLSLFPISSRIKKQQQQLIKNIVVITLFPLLLLLLLPFSPSSAASIIDAKTTSGSDNGSGGGAQQCPQWVNHEIQQCVQPVAEFAKTLNKQQLEEQQQWQNNQNAPLTHPKEANSATTTTIDNGSLSSRFGSALQWPTKLGGQVFRELCRLINDFELCVDGYRDKCRHHITIGLIQASYGFLCNEGYEVFMASAQCLMELDQQPNVKSCHDRTLQEIEEANNERNGTVNSKLDKMCSALNYFSDCVRPFITHSCGLDAWKVIFRVLKDTSRTLMPMCHFDDDYDEEDDTVDGDGQQTTMAQKQQMPGKMNRQRQWQSGSGEDDDKIKHQRKYLDHDERREFAENDDRPLADWERWEEEEEERQEEDDDADIRRHDDTKYHPNGWEQKGAMTGASSSINDDGENAYSSGHQIHYGSHPLQQKNDAGMPFQSFSLTITMRITVFFYCAFHFSPMF